VSAILQEMDMGHGFNSTTRWLVLALPVVMGVIEFMLRVALHQADKVEFFPVSLVVAGISLCVALTSLSCTAGSETEGLQVRREPAGRSRTRNCDWEEWVAKLGIWMAVVGVTAWVYLLTASFSDEVKAVIPYYPLQGALLYYLLGIVLTEWKARKQTPCTTQCSFGLNIGKPSSSRASFG
jgi:hypothetical protein